MKGYDAFLLFVEVHAIEFSESFQFHSAHSNKQHEITNRDKLGTFSMSVCSWHTCLQNRNIKNAQIALVE